MSTTRSKARTAPIRAAIYVRISADQKLGTDQEAAGVERQEAQARKLAEAKEWTIAGLYSDNDKSASNGKVRPAFEEMIKDIGAGRIDAILVWHFDRLIRKMSDLTRIIEIGGPVKLNISAVQGISLDMSDPTGVAVAQILTAIAGMEVAHKGARQSAANAQRAADGQVNASTRCYGFNSDGTVREVEAAYVRKVFEQFNGGAPVTGITAMMRELGAPTAASGRAVGALRKAKVEALKSGDPLVHNGWSRTGIRKILQNRRYLGEVWYHGEHVADGQPAIIEADAFAAAQARLADPTRTTTTGPSRRWLGAGVYRCGECGGKLVSLGGSYAGKGGVRIANPSYRCPGHLTRSAVAIDTDVKDRVAQWLEADLPVRGALRDDSEQAVSHNLRNEAKALRAAQDSYGRAYARGVLTERQVKLNTADADKRIKQITAELAARGRRSALEEVQNAEHPGQAWLDMDIWRQAEVLEEVATVTVLKVGLGNRGFDPASVRIDWKL